MSFYVSPTFNLDDNTWSETAFVNRKETLKFIKSKVKYPGEYNLKYTQGLWNEQAVIFQNNEKKTGHGSYPNYVKNSTDYRNHWDFEEKKCVFEGFIIYKKPSENLEFVVPCLYYWYLNYCPIPDKVKQKDDFPEIYDGDLHYFLYILECIIDRKFGVVLKKRQSGFTLKNMAIMLNAIWFGRSATSKIFAFDENKVVESWVFITQYRDHNNRHCAWRRGFDPGKPLDWIMRRKQTDGSFKGRNCQAKGFTTKQNPSNGIGGSAKVIFGEEAGANPTLDKTHEFITSNVSYGGLTTGLIIYSGAVGELEQAEPLKNFIRFPEKNGFVSRPNNIEADLELGDVVGFFAPEWWNYVSVERDEEGKPIGEALKCFDEWGNTNKKLALEEITQWRKLAEERDPDKFRYYCSQRPLSITEAFAFRKESKWPLNLVQAQKRRIADRLYGEEHLDIVHNEKGELVFEKASKGPIMEFPLPKATADKEGCIVVYERPKGKPELGKQFLASIDTIKEGKAEYVNNLVYTPRGRKRIGDIVIGDSVIGSDGKATTVTGVFPQGIVDLYNVSFTDGTKVLVCEDHLWAVKLVGGAREEIVLSTKQLFNKQGTVCFTGTGRNKDKVYNCSTYYESSRGCKKWRIPIVKPIVFENKQLLPVNPYLLGLLLGDGGLTQKSVKFTTADLEIIKTIKKILPKDLIIEKITVKNSYDYIIKKQKGYRNSLTTSLKLLGLSGKGSKTKFIPESYQYTSIENRLKLLQGLMDTDGYCGNHGAEFYTTSKLLSEGVIQLVRGLGGIAKVRVKKTKWTHKGKENFGICYCVRVNLPRPMNPFRLLRKANKYYFSNRFSKYVDKIEYTKRGEAVCISVDAKDSLYVTEDAIVTHNTTTSASLFSIMIYRLDTEVTRYGEEVENWIEPGKLAAEWCGRFDDINKTHERALNMLEMYGAKAVVEVNVSEFVNYVIFKKKQQYLVPKSQILFLKELGANESAFQEYGWKNTGKLFETHLIRYGIEFLKEELDVITTPDGKEVKKVYGIERLPSIMLMKEMEAYQPGVNVDRLVTFCALAAYIKIYLANFGYNKRREETSSRPAVDPNLYTKPSSFFKTRGNISGDQKYNVKKGFFKDRG